ncbi:hypothetical protein [Streptomyces sp. NRRL WC-3742]|nr:hypothetical protein [Streptomyces sp. NRRL WC-3742]
MVDTAPEPSLYSVSALHERARGDVERAIDLVIADDEASGGRRS